MPPTTSTRPSGSNVAVWPERAVCILPICEMLPIVVVRAKDLWPPTIHTTLTVIKAPQTANAPIRNLAVITTSLLRTTTLEQILERRAQKEKRRPSLDGVFLLISF